MSQVTGGVKALVERNHQLTDEALETLIESLQVLHVAIDPAVRQSLKNVLYSVDRYARLNEAVNVAQDLAEHRYTEAAAHVLSQIKKEPLWQLDLNEASDARIGSK